MKQILTFIIVLIFISSCDQKVTELTLSNEQTDLSALEKEIELRLREYENHLKNGDSIAWRAMYMVDAENNTFYCR